MDATKDFGAIRQAPWLGAAKVAVLAAAVPLSIAVAWGILFLPSHHQRAAAMAEDAAWIVSGPPCPAITAPWWRTLAIAQPQRFGFEGVAGVRAHGDVSCVEVDSDHGRAVKPFPVCQFTAPFAIRLQTSRGPIYLEPGVGQPAVISLRDGEVRCVVGRTTAAG